MRKPNELEKIVLRWYIARDEALSNDCKDCKREHREALAKLLSHGKWLEKKFGRVARKD